ncbi:hypothetical protein D3C84_540640 [compost metagenome]
MIAITQRCPLFQQSGLLHPHCHDLVTQLPQQLLLRLGPDRRHINRVDVLHQPEWRHIVLPAPERTRHQATYGTECISPVSRTVGGHHRIACELCHQAFPFAEALQQGRRFNRGQVEQPPQKHQAPETGQNLQAALQVGLETISLGEHRGEVTVGFEIDFQRAAYLMHRLLLGLCTRHDGELDIIDTQRLLIHHAPVEHPVKVRQLSILAVYRQHVDERRKLFSLAAINAVQLLEQPEAAQGGGA